MRTFFALLLTLLLTACITVETQTPPPPVFVTSTLPPPPTPYYTSTPTPPGMATLPRPVNCKDAAVLLMDVTFPDGTRLTPGQTFTKTWRLRNMGTCPWDGKYRLVYSAGERMNAPDSVPMPVTESRADADVSVDLVAPATDGSYAGYFELHNPDGEVIPIGLERSIWVKIIVGAGAPPATNPPTVQPTTGASGGITPVQTASSCTVSANAGYVNQLLGMINAARTSANLPVLTFNPQLAAAAQSHSADMACNNFLDHSGSDGSYIDDRIRAAGYAPSYWLETIAIGTPQDAMTQWQASSIHWAAILDPKVTEIGIGYAYYAQSNYGGYFTVDFASP